jgi:hypothetical protein
VSDGLSKISKLLEAIDYILSHWAGLTLFLGDGRLEPDTNCVERNIRPIALGRNYARVGIMHGFRMGRRARFVGIINAFRLRVPAVGLPSVRFYFP